VKVTVSLFEFVLAVLMLGIALDILSDITVENYFPGTRYATQIQQLEKAGFFIVVRTVFLGFGVLIRHEL